MTHELQAFKSTLSILRIIAAAIVALSVASAPARADQNDLRILSVGSDVTEIIYALGMGDQIVAVDTTSQHPPDALASNPNVGYMRALSAEGVLAIGANLLLISEGAGPPETIRALKSSSARYVEVPDGKTAEGVSEKIIMIGDVLGVSARARDLAATFKTQIATLEKQRNKVSEPKSVLFVLNASGGRLIVGGRGTSADAYLKLAGATNAASAISGFKPVTAEGVITMAPDAIVVMKGGRNGQTASELIATPAIAATPAGKAQKAVDVSGVRALGFGPRLPGAATDLMSWLYGSEVTAQ